MRYLPADMLSEDEIFRLTIHTFDDVSILAYLAYNDQQLFMKKIKKSLDKVGSNLEPENVITIKWFLKKLNDGARGEIDSKNKKVKNAFKDLLFWEQRVLGIRFRSSINTNVLRTKLEKATEIIRKSLEKLKGV